MAKDYNIRESNIMEALGNIHKDIATIQNDVDWIKKSLEATQADILNKDAENKKAYAPKWIIYPLISVASTILVAIVGALLGLILIPPTKAIAMIFINLIC